MTSDSFSYLLMESKSVPLSESSKEACESLKRSC